MGANDADGEEDTVGGKDSGSPTKNVFEMDVLKKPGFSRIIEPAAE